MLFCSKTNEQKLVDDTLSDNDNTAYYFWDGKDWESAIKLTKQEGSKTVLVTFDEDDNKRGEIDVEIEDQLIEWKNIELPTCSIKSETLIQGDQDRLLYCFYEKEDDLEDIADERGDEDGSEDDNDGLPEKIFMLKKYDFQIQDEEGEED